MNTPLSTNENHLDVKVTGIEPIKDAISWEWFRKRYFRADDHPFWNAVPKKDYNPETDKEKGYYEIFWLNSGTIRVVAHKEK